MSFPLTHVYDITYNVIEMWFCVAFKSNFSIILSDRSICCHVRISVMEVTSGFVNL